MLAGAGHAGVDARTIVDVLTSPDAELDELLGLLASLCDSPAAGVTVFAGSDLHVPVAVGVRPFVSPVSETFCGATRDHDGLFCVEDAAEDPRFARFATTDGPFGKVRFYASAPLHGPGGTMVGRLCVIDESPRTLTPLQLRSLRTLAVSASQRLELRLREHAALSDVPRSPAPEVPHRSGAPTPAPSRTDGSDRPPRDDASVTERVSQLAAELSHDLRVPLTSVIASVELLEEELGDHPDRAVASLLTRAVRAADRMIRMLDQNMGVGGEGNRLTRVDLGEVVDQLVLDSAPILEPVGALVEYRGLPVVRADPDDMYSVLQNLVTNSVKFARPDVPAWVRISARPAGELWRISVRDNGVGIAEDRRVDVFSLFSRTGGEVEGHGIGLATVARIVKAHGGRAGVEPVPGSGTEVWFEVPRA